MNIQHFTIATLSLGLLFVILVPGGCAEFEASGTTAVSSVAQQPASIEDLKAREATADSREEIEALISLYEDISGDNTQIAQAKTRVASLYLLLGAQYSNSTSEKRRLYRSAANATEEALLQNKRFLSARGMGRSIPEAAVDLPIDFYEALFLWATATFYHFRDVASVPERILFRNRLSEAAEAIELMMDKHPDWYGGSLQFSLGIYYLSLPEVIGGDRQRAIKLMNEAVNMSQNRLLPRWGRAKYLAVATADRKLFTDDLSWVIQQDLSKMEGPPIWNRYFVEDAGRLLSQAEILF